MPGIGGFELADMVHQHPRFQNTPIIFVSAVCLSDLDQLKGYRHGAVDYISVPIVPKLLRAKIRVFADLHRKTRQLELLNTELHRLSNRLIGAQDEERRRIARELHDGLGQELAAAKMILDQISAETSPQQADELRQVIDLLLKMCATCHTCYILLYWTKSDCFRRFDVIWMDLPNGVGSERLWKYAHRTSRDLLPSWKWQCFGSFRRD